MQCIWPIFIFSSDIDNIEWLHQVQARLECHLPEMKKNALLNSWYIATRSYYHQKDTNIYIYLNWEINQPCCCQPLTGVSFFLMYTLALLHHKSWSVVAVWLIKSLEDNVWLLVQEIMSIITNNKSKFIS